MSSDLEKKHDLAVAALRVVGGLSAATARRVASGRGSHLVYVSTFDLKGLMKMIDAAYAGATEKLIKSMAVEEKKRRQASSQESK
jgi:hypothetical protein